MKKCLYLFLVLMLISIPAFAADEVTVIVDGCELVCDVPGEVINGRTFVPLRAIAEKLGARVEWDESTQGITLIRDEKEISLSVGSLSANITENGNVTGAKFDAAPYIKSERTMVPLRFIAQSFGRRAAWSQETKTAIVTQIRILPDSSFKALSEKYFSSVLPAAIKQNNEILAKDITENPQSVMAYFSNLWTDEAVKLLSEKAEEKDFSELAAISDEGLKYDFLLELGQRYDIPIECPVRMCAVNNGLLLDGPGQRVIDASPLCILQSVDGRVVCENLN